MNARAKKNLTVAAVLLGIGVAAFLIFHFLTIGERNAWEKARKENTWESYHEFLKEYPSGERAQMAHAAMRRFNAEAEKGHRARMALAERRWDEIRDDGKIESMTAFLQEFPDSQWAAPARYIRERLRWQHLQSEEALGSWAAFLEDLPSRDTYPGQTTGASDWDERRRVAWEKIERAWEKARKEDTLEAFYTCLKPYPKLEALISPSEKFAGVWEGKGMASAPAFQGKGPHALILLTEKGMVHEWNDRLPALWRTGDPATTSMVLVVEKQIESTQTTMYQFEGRPAPSITTFRYDLHVRLVETRTGQTLATKHFKRIPNAARSSEPYSLTTISAGRITVSELENWLRPWIVGESQPDKTVSGRK